LFGIMGATAFGNCTSSALKTRRRYLVLISKQWDNALVRLRKFVED
jgi:hypothetical protein